MYSTNILRLESSKLNMRGQFAVMAPISKSFERYRNSLFVFRVWFNLMSLLCLLLLCLQYCVYYYEFYKKCA